MFYTQSVFCSPPFIPSPYFIPSPQSVVRSLQSVFYTDRYIYAFNMPLSVQYSTIRKVLHARLRLKIVTFDASRPLYFLYFQAKVSQVTVDTGYFAYFHSFAVTLRTFIFGYKNSIFFYRRRSYEMKKIRFRKSCCIGKNPVFPEVIYRYLISFP